MAYYNRGKALEADPENLQFGYITVDVNRPPHVPPIQPPIPELRGWIPYIAGSLCDQIQAQATANPLRTYMFNMCAYNQFANEFFDSVVLSAVDMASWLVDTQRYPVQEAVNIAIEDINDMTVAANCAEYPDLWNFVDPNSRRAVEETIAKFEAVGRDINAWKNPRGRGGSYSGRSGGSYSGRSGGTYQAPGGRSSGGYSAGVSSGSSSSYSARTPAQRGSSASNAPARRGSWADRNARQEAPVEEPIVVQAAPKEVPATIDNWRPSRTYPYFLAYDVRGQIATLDQQDDGTLQPVITNKSEKQMDYDAHATPNAFGKAPAFVDLSNAARTIENVRSGINKINKDSELPPAEEGKPSLRATICDNWITESCESTAWLVANLERQLHDKERSHVYRVYGTVADGLLTLDDENPYVAQLAAAKGFLGLKGLMETLGANMSLDLLGAINKRMTQLINRKLHLEMGLKLTISSFRDDIDDVLRILDEKYDFKSQFLKNQIADIQRTLLPLKPEPYGKFVAGLLVGMDFNGATPNIACVSSNYSFTFLDMNSWEINIQVGENGVPARVSKEITPDFYELVKGAFEDAANYRLEGSTESSISRVLFRTLDGAVMEATRGALVSDAYLLTAIG